MPTVFIVFGFILKFYSNEHYPIHIHVIKGNARAKFLIDPVELIENQCLKTSEIKLIESVIEENKEVIAEHWNKYFNNSAK